MRAVRGRATPELVAGLALLALALAVVVVGGARQAREVPVYLPVEEAFHVALVEHVATHGTLPNVDEDRFVVDPPGGVAPPGVLILTGSDASGSVVNPAPGAVVPQLNGVEPPLYPYVTIWAGWLADGAALADLLRAVDLVFYAAAVLLLFLAVRASAPWRGGVVAAGLSACLLAGLPGLEATLLTPAPAALGLALLAGMLWALARGLRDGRASLAVPVLGGLAALTATQFLPAAALATGASLWPRRRELGRHGVARHVLALLAPTLLWMAWNVSEYGNPFPVNHGGAEPRPWRWEALTETPGLILFVLRESIRAMSVLVLPGPEDRLPNALGVISLTFVAALVVLLLRAPRRDGSERTLRLWGVVWPLSFLSVYVGLTLLAVAQGAPADLSPGRFAPFALGWAAFAGPVLVAPLVGLPWRRIAWAPVAWAGVLGLGMALPALHALA